SGISAVTISNMALSGDYLRTTTCTSSLAPGASCTLTLKFRPTAPRARYGAVTITDSDGGSPHLLNLTGKATWATASVKTLNFGSVQVGTSSVPKQFSLTNQGTDPLSISDVIFFWDLNSFNLPDYSQTNDCGGSLAGGASCIFTVTFSPLATGNRGGTMRILDSEVATSPFVITLVGTGTP